MNAPMSDADWAWLRAEVDQATAHFCDSLRMVGHSTGANSAVPGMDWTAGQLGAHLVSMPTWYRETIAAPKPFVMPPDLGANSLRLLKAVGTTDIDELTVMLPEAINGLLEEYGNDANAEVDWYVPCRLSQVAGAFLTELVFHRQDLAAITGENVVMTDRQAVAATRSLFPVSMVLVDPVVARTCNGTMHIKIRNGDDWTVKVKGETATVDMTKPPKADWHTIADALTMVSVGYGRVNPIKAALTGKVWGYGRKPMMAIRSQKLFSPL